MIKDRDALTNDGYNTASDIIYDSAGAVAGLIGLPRGDEAKQMVLENYPVIVACHAILTFLDARYEERFPPESDGDNEDTPSPEG